MILRHHTILACFPPMGDTKQSRLESISGLSESDYALPPNEQLLRYIFAITSYIRWNDDDVHFVLVQQA
jgi:hypothetical protein